MLDPGAGLAALLDDAVRQRLRDRWGAAAGPWLAALPGLAADCCRRWDLTLDRAMPGGTAAVFAGRAAGRPAVLKLMPDPVIAAGEAASLRAWAATPHAAGLLAADEPAGALLLEYVPGVLVSTGPRLPPAAAVAALLRGLRDFEPVAAAGLAPLAQRVDAMYDLAERWRAAGPAAAVVSADLMRRGHAAARELADGGPDGLVHGDLHPANVLAAGAGRGLVAIDPRPTRGDPDFDIIDFALTRAATARQARDRVRRLAALVPGLDAGRAWRWCAAAAVINALVALRQDAPAAHTALLLNLAASA
jgi:streptomycin 6-kinase